MITVRQLYAADDLDQVLALCKAFLREYEAQHEAFFDTDELTDDDISGRFVDSITSDNTATLVALVDGDIVGYASIAVRPQLRFYQVKLVGAISGLMVTPAHRRRGIGTRLLRAAIEWFRERGLRTYTVYTAVANEGALALYQRSGMIPLHTTHLGEIEEPFRHA